MVGWEDLEDVQLSAVWPCLDDLGLSHDPDAEYCTMFADEWDIFQRTLYLNEDLFERHSEGYLYPGLVLSANDGEKRLLFRRTLLEDTFFCSDLRTFWTDYVSYCSLCTSFILPSFSSDGPSDTRLHRVR
jgi:hypothetical protein